MSDSFIPDEVDLQIINALQIRPRASWSQIAGVIGIDPATAARRWRRLEDAGAAWIACNPPYESLTAIAHVEIDCVHGRTADVAQQLARDSASVSITINAGGRDLQVMVWTCTSKELARYVLDRLAQIDGIRAVRTFPIVRIYREATGWRLGALNAEQSRRLRPPSAVMVKPLSRQLTDAEWAVFNALNRDPRIEIKQLAYELGVSPSTARRRLDDLLNNQSILRTEVARSLSGTPVYATFFGVCPAERLDSTAEALTTLPEIRGVSTHAGKHNVFITAWLRSLEHVQTFEAEIARKLPHLRIVDRTTVLRTIKLIGRLMDDDGWSIGSVSTDVRQTSMGDVEGLPDRAQLRPGP
ncbi:Lrp/AsnC family transcriptional regulator [Paenarthrobacter sp. JL.01a]|uniref:Lrp/AsnC family transcriptional regulator n=1 Tax=Paenarthrobacter sp. JL.01a TaxID=2979324 RepID=UPI0021C85910|nr:Lrp/AsnC family transcriptional regulator [Paenarthrobacter sp. JL.01a]UXM92501.1 Lrp/AsnC family transcriptional regulator [Paenarthrobacter sp. JL.01a]